MSNKNGHYVDQTGKLLGYYYEGYEPEGSIYVPVTSPDGRMVWSFTEEKWFWPKEVAREVAIYNLNSDFTEAMKGLQTGWPIYEVLTWDKQSTEANTWLAAPADAKPATPFLSSLLEKCLALGAQDTLDNLVGRVHANDLQYTEAVTAIMAVRHVAEDQINASDEPMSVTWQFPS